MPVRLKAPRHMICPGSGLTPTQFRGEQKITAAGRIQYQQGLCEICHQWKAVNANNRRTLRKHKKKIAS